MAEPNTNPYRPIPASEAAQLPRALFRQSRAGPVFVVKHDGFEVSRQVVGIKGCIRPAAIFSHRALGQRIGLKAHIVTIEGQARLGPLWLRRNKTRGPGRRKNRDRIDRFRRLATRQSGSPGKDRRPAPHRRLPSPDQFGTPVAALSSVPSWRALAVASASRSSASMATSSFSASARRALPSSAICRLS